MTADPDSKNDATGTPRDPDHQIIDAAMALIAERGLDAIALADIADRAGLSLSALHGRFAGKRAILRAFTQRIDAAVLSSVDGAVPDPEETARDRLFDVIMHRFDALQPYRHAIRRLLDDGWRKPGGLLGQAGALIGSMGWMLEAARIDSAGALGEVRKLALAGAYAATVRDWLRDDSPDLARTMATLDRQLRRLQSMARRRESKNHTSAKAGFEGECR